MDVGYRAPGCQSKVFGLKLASGSGQNQPIMGGHLRPGAVGGPQPIVIDPYYGDASGSSNALYPNIHDIAIRQFHYNDVNGSIYDGAAASLILRGYQSQAQTHALAKLTFDNVVFDSTPSWGSTSLAFAVPSYVSLTMGPGPVSFANLLLASNGSNHVSVTDQRTSSGAAYDCSSAFVDFPAADAPMSIH